ncbi:hypothetical protein D3C72_1825140 [compost metagenome]
MGEPDSRYKEFEILRPTAYIKGSHYESTQQIENQYKATNDGPVQFDCSTQAVTACLMIFLIASTSAVTPASSLAI